MEGNNLVLEDGTVVNSKQLEDGSFRIADSKGVEKTLTPDEAKELFANVQRNRGSKYMDFVEENVKTVDDPSKIHQCYAVALSSLQDEYPNVKSAMENPNVKSTVLKCFGEFAQMCSENKWISSKKNAGAEIAECILEYPKVIVEDHYSKDLTPMEDAFKEVGDIRLPFPKMVIISGEHVDLEKSNANKLGTSNVVHGSTYNNGTINMLYCYFLTQQEYGIDIDIFLANENDKKKIYIHTAGIFHDGTKLQFLRVDKQRVMPHSPLDGYLRSALVAIHMMTMNKGDFYMSVPTPEEIAVNKKRINKGKKPMIEFRMVTIDGKKRDLPSVPHGTHASPRLHWRRGHWRTMKKSGKKVWIDPMLVGDEANGKIIKDYAVGQYNERNIHGTQMQTA